MATIAEQLIGTVAQNAGKAPDLAGSINQGAQLGLHIQQLQYQRAELEQKKQDLQTQKLQKFGDDVAKIHDFKDANARNGYVKFLKAQNQQLGLKIPDEALDFAFAGPENIARVGTLQTMVQSGDITGPQAISVLTDPSQFAKIVPQNKYSGPSFAAPDALQGIDIQEASDKIAKANAERQGNLAQENRAASYGTQALTRKDEQAASAVKTVNNDEQLKILSTQSRNITKGLGLLTDPAHPPSFKAISEIAQDFAGALSGKAASSDFKLKEIKQNTLNTELANLKAFLSDNPDQPASPEIVKFWTNLGQRLDQVYDDQKANRANQITQDYGTIYKNNPSAVEAGKAAADRFKTGQSEGFYRIGNKKVSEDQAREFYRAHPEFLKTNTKAKKDLGL